MTAAVWVPLLSSVISALLSSVGLWTLINNKIKTQNVSAQLLMGLTYDKIVSRGMSYINRGWITKDEFEDFQKHFYAPYKEMGGNGVAEQIMEQVKKLPFGGPQLYFELNTRRNGKEYHNDGWAAPSNTRHAIEQPRL